MDDPRSALWKTLFAAARGKNTAVSFFQNYSRVLWIILKGYLGKKFSAEIIVCMFAFFCNEKGIHIVGKIMSAFEKPQFALTINWAKNLRCVQTKILSFILWFSQKSIFSFCKQTAFSATEISVPEFYNTYIVSPKKRILWKRDFFKKNFSKGKVCLSEALFVFSFLLSEREKNCGKSHAQKMHRLGLYPKIPIRKFYRLSYIKQGDRQALRDPRMKFSVFPVRDIFI